MQTGMSEEEAQMVFEQELAERDALEEAEAVAADDARNTRVGVNEAEKDGGVEMKLDDEWTIINNSFFEI